MVPYISECEIKNLSYYTLKRVILLKRFLRSHAVTIVNNIAALLVTVYRDM
jgi:hypothetical protein